MNKQTYSRDQVIKYNCTTSIKKIMSQCKDKVPSIRNRNNNRKLVSLLIAKKQNSVEDF